MGNIKTFWMIGGAVLLGHAGLRIYSPLQDHIRVFLGLHAALGLLWLAAALWLRKHEDAVPPLGGFILAIALGSRLLLMTAPPSFSTDVYRYVWDGRVQAAGINPYLFSPSAPELLRLKDGSHPLINNPSLSTIYPPLAQWAFRVAAKASPTVYAQKALFALFDLLTAWLLMRWLRSRGRSPGWAALYAWHPLTAVEFAGAGHLDSLMIFALTAGLYLAERGWAAAAGAALGAAAMAKLAPLILIPWMLVQKRWRMALSFFGVLLVCIAPYIPELWAAHLDGRPLFTGLKAYASRWLANPSLYALAGLALPDPTMRKVLFAAVLVLLSAPWALVNRDRLSVYALGSLFALLLVSPVVQPWYVLWLLPLACINRLWSALAWTWLTGFAYIVLDEPMREWTWRYPSWFWVWIGQYAVVYGLLAMELAKKLRPAVVTNQMPALLTLRRP